MPTDALAATVLDPQQIFAFLFLMLGPVKLLAPFVAMTRQGDPAFRRALANRAIVLSAAALLLAGALGDKMVENFRIPLPVLALAGGLILFLVALNTILAQFSPAMPPSPEATPRELHAAAMRLAFPIIVTPSSIAAIIIFAALAKENARGLLVIVAITLVILVLDWLAMLYAAAILRWGQVALQLFAVILGVIQVSLGLQLMLRGLSLSGALPLPAG